jgi:hypothetical protein
MVKLDKMVVWYNKNEPKEHKLTGSLKGIFKICYFKILFFGNQYCLVKLNRKTDRPNRWSNI